MGVFIQQQGKFPFFPCPLDKISVFSVTNTSGGRDFSLLSHTQKNGCTFIQHFPVTCSTSTFFLCKIQKELSPLSIAPKYSIPDKE